MLILKAGGRGDVTTSHKLWDFQNGPDVPTPVTDGTYLYVVNDRGIAYCLELKTGKAVYGPERLTPGTYSASPVLADGKIYITSEDGIATVYRAGPKFEILAENKMDDYTLSSIAVKEGQIFLRTAGWLWVIGQRGGTRTGVTVCGPRSDGPRPAGPVTVHGALGCAVGSKGPSLRQRLPGRSPDRASGLGPILGGWIARVAKTLTRGAPPNTRGITYSGDAPARNE